MRCFDNRTVPGSFLRNISGVFSNMNLKISFNFVEYIFFKECASIEGKRMRDFLEIHLEEWKQLSTIVVLKKNHFLCFLQIGIVSRPLSENTSLLKNAGTGSADTDSEDMEDFMPYREWIWSSSFYGREKKGWHLKFLQRLLYYSHEMPKHVV